MGQNILSLPDNLMQMLSAADQSRGFPAGTMASVLQQEIGGQYDKFLGDPAAPHYPSGIAPNGKRSSAFGPFGILESTARDPGFGVAPLTDKGLAEQVRFAADYLAARSRQAGSLKAGLTRYGDGVGYADKVMSRAAGAAPVQVAATAAPVAQPVPVVATPEAMTQVPVQPSAPPERVVPGRDPWTEFVQGVAAASPPTQESLNYGDPVQQSRPVQIPDDYLALLTTEPKNQVQFGSFLPRRARRVA